jgi:hypothetical protein
VKILLLSRLFPCFLLLVWFVDAQNNSGDVGSAGIITGKTYLNDNLAMTITLPGNGSWRLLGKATNLADKRAVAASPPNGCVGPLCGQADINVAVLSESVPGEAILLVAYHLSAEYQNQARHPLVNFAQTMILNSLGGQWIPETGLAPAKLGDRPAFRLVTRNKGNPAAKGFMYVSRSNGYVFLLVGTAIRNPEELRTAIEGMQLRKSTP